MFQRIVCFAAVTFAAVTGAASDLPGSMLYIKGTVWVNGHPVPAFTAAIFPGDIVETKAESVANINTAGTSVALQPNSLVRLEADSIVLQSGGITVITSNRMSVRAGEVSATPSLSNETEFEVSHSSNRVEVSARRNDVRVGCGTDSTTVQEGQAITRDESGHCKRKVGAYAPVKANILDSPWTWGGLLTGGGLCAWLCPSISQWHP